MAGRLFVCGTPIGNLSDMSDRLKETLEEVDLIAAEDTRNSLKLLNHLGIKKPLTSFHQHNRFEKGEVLLRQLEKGVNIALISDAGMPGISDPGQELISSCNDAGIGVTVIPGPTAFATALVMSGFDSDRFFYEGFLPTDKKERESILKELKTRTVTTVIYEAPHRLTETAAELFDALGDRKAAFCKELTKLHEECRIMPLSEAVSYYRENVPKGEYVIVLEGKDKEELKEESIREWEQLSPEEHMDMYIREGLDRTSAMKKVAKDRGLSKRDVYDMLLQDKEEG